MSLDTVLVVVDVQTVFVAARAKRLIDNVVREVKNAITKHNFIAIVTYDGCGTLAAALNSAVEDYQHHKIIGKDCDDGSYVVEQELYRQGINPLHIKVCGVNTECCVKQTVEGLSSRFNRCNIEIVRDACNSDRYCSDVMSTLKKLPNVSVRG